MKPTVRVHCSYATPQAYSKNKPKKKIRRNSDFQIDRPKLKNEKNKNLQSSTNQFNLR